MEVIIVLLVLLVGTLIGYFYNQRLKLKLNSENRSKELDLEILKEKNQVVCTHSWDIEVRMFDITSKSITSGVSTCTGKSYIRECSKCHEVRQFLCKLE